MRQTLEVIRSTFRAPDQAIDFGTAYLRVAAGHNGAIVERRSAVSHSNAALQPPLYPLRGGAICDVGTAVAVLEPVMRLLRGRLAPPRVLACVPSDATADERQALVEAACAAGARQVAIVPEPVASAVGAGLETGDGQARLLVDIGDGVTDLAVIRDGQMAFNRSLRVACGNIRAALVAHVLERHELELDLDQADDLVAESGRFCGGSNGVVQVTGRRAGTRRLVKALLTRDEILAATLEVEVLITGFVAGCVRALPDALAVDVIESGIRVTGGGALLTRLVAGIGARAGLTASAANDPLRATISGARAMLPVAAKTGLWDA
jgi:rod shape-determining protein MreB